VLRIRATIEVQGGQQPIAGPCWEAVIGMAGGSVSKTLGPYMFRRITPVRQRATQPFVGQMRILTVSPSRRLDFSASSRNWRTQHLDALPDYPDEDVGVLVVQSEVGIANDAVRLTLGGRTSAHFTPNDVTRLFPNLRLCILMDLERSELSKRTSVDRISAARARTAAHELFVSGIPAVITIPYLPVRTDLTNRTLAILSKAASGNSANATYALQSAVREVQQLVYQQSGLSRSDSTELAYDVCYYAADVVNLRVTPIRRAPASRRGPSARKA
jgi:hypothetical protein